VSARAAAVQYRALMTSQPLPTILAERFEAALRFAATVHCTQTRKGSGIPYIGHLLGVCSLVIEDGGSEDEAIAALLHDAVEDQGGEPMLAQIRERFGEEVAAIVRATRSETRFSPKARLTATMAGNRVCLGVSPRKVGSAH
jgi:(p)ppGpp synthase/HD superfamily hydrolase